MSHLRKRLSRGPLTAAAMGVLALHAGIAAAVPPATPPNADLDIRVCVDQGGGQETCFAALSVGFQVTNVPAAPGGGGGGASRPAFSDVVIGKLLDAFTPKFFLWAATGMAIPSVAITVAPRNQGVTMIEAEDVFITKSGPDISTDSGIPVEVVNLNYRKITITSGQNTACFNVATSSNC